MKLSQIMEQVRGLSYDKKDISNDNLEGFIPVLRAGNIQDSKLNNEDFLFIPHQKVKEKQFLKFGDILIAASSGSISIVGKAAMVERDMNATFGAFCKVLRPNYKKVDFGYFKHFFETSYYKRTIKSLAEGANINNLKTEHFDELEIPLPPLEQQKKIAAILDASDAYRQKTKALIAKYDELTQSLFLDMFGDPVKNEKGWEKKNLASILDFLTSGSRGWAKYYSDKGDLFLRIQNVGYNKLKLDDLCYINTPDNAEAKRTKLIPGDIVLSITADLGRTAVVPEKFPNAYINQHLALLRLTKENNPIYVSSFIASKGGQTLFNKLDKGGVKAGLNFTDIKSYNILCPPIEIQNQFAERVQAIELQKAQAQASLEKAEELFNSLLQRAFKGGIV